MLYNGDRERSGSGKDVLSINTSNIKDLILRESEEGLETYYVHHLPILMKGPVFFFFFSLYKILVYLST